jgi:cell shape-determining protein MreC
MAKLLKKEVKLRESALFRHVRIISLRLWALFGLVFLILLTSIKGIKTKNNASSLSLFLEPFLTQTAKCLKKCENFFLFAWSEKKQLWERIENLEINLAQYEKELFKCKQIIEENDYLRKLLPLAEGQSGHTVTLPLLFQRNHPFLIAANAPENIGESIKIGHLVVAPQGVVGQVVAKNETKILILLATHIQSRLPVVSRQSRKKALLFGQNSRYFELRYIKSAASLDALPFQSEASKPFVESANGNDADETDWVEGELLDFIDSRLPVAKIIKKEGKFCAEWVIDPLSPYITIVTMGNAISKLFDFSTDNGASTPHPSRAQK